MITAQHEALVGVDGLVMKTWIADEARLGGFHIFRDAARAYIGVGVVVANGDVGLVAYDEGTGVEKWRAVDGFDPHVRADGKVVSLWQGALEARSTDDGVVVWNRSEPFGPPFMNNLTTTSSTVFVAINSLPWAD